jgi:hypothetical protein
MDMFHFGAMMKYGEIIVDIDPFEGSDCIVDLIVVDYVMRNTRPVIAH